MNHLIFIVVSGMKKNKLFEVDGPNDYRVDRMYMEDKTGVYVYQQDCSANDLL